MLWPSLYTCTCDKTVIYLEALLLLYYLYTSSSDTVHSAFPEHDLAQELTIIHRSIKVIQVHVHVYTHELVYMHVPVYAVLVPVCSWKQPQSSLVCGWRGVLTCHTAPAVYHSAVCSLQLGRNHLGTEAALWMSQSSPGREMGGRIDESSMVHDVHVNLHVQCIYTEPKWGI